MKRVVSPLAVSLLALMATAGLSGAQSPKHKVYAHFAGPWQVKPRTLYLGNFAIEELQWVGWNDPATIGVGTYPYNDCRPYCAKGHITPYETTVTLSRIIPCHDKRNYIYSKIRYVLEPGAPFHESHFLINCSGRVRGNVTN